MYHTSKEVYLPGNHYISRQVYEYISRQTNDPIVEWKTCVVSGTQFPIYQSDLDFYAKISPTFAGERFQIPTPTLCPEERQRRRLSFLNQRNIYKSRCSSCGDTMISRFHINCGLLVYCNKCRTINQFTSDGFNLETNVNQNFFKNISTLIKNTPFQNLIGSFSNLNTNAIYTNYTADISDSYMIFEGDDIRNSYYSSDIKKSSNCVDCCYISRCENCYGSVDLSNCFSCYGSYRLNNCSYMINSRNCLNCNFCCGCDGLVGKSYYVNNIYIGKENYENKVHYSNNTSQIQFNLQMIFSEGSIGNSLINTKDCVFCYDSFECNTGKYSTSMNTAQDFFDVDSFGSNSYLLYNSLSIGRFSNKIYFCNTIGKGENLYYCYDVKKSKNCFGCVNLKDSEYCIFNKQYTKEEYEIQVAKIIRHMMETGERGEFFHPSLSPFGYNETVAQEYYPVTPPSPSGDEVGVLRRGMSEGQGEVLGTLGYHRSTYSSDPKIPEGARVIDCRLPERGEDTQQRKNLNQTTIFDYHHTEGPVPPTYDICKQIILCELSGRPFMLQKAEIDFYRKHNLPLPRKHPDVRHEERMKLRPGRTLFLRTCDCCGKEMLSVYPASQSGGEETIQRVYCEECYQKEVYG